MDLQSYLDDLRARQAASRPADTPGEVSYPLGERTLSAHVDHWAEVRPDRLAIVCGEARLTWADLHAQVVAVAAAMRTEGVGPGDRVGVHLPNRPEFVVSMLAALRLGAVFVPVNPMFRPQELAHELTDAGVRLLVTLDALAPVVGAVRDEARDLRTVVVIGEPVDGMLAWEDFTASGAGVEVEDAGDLDSLAALNYTGGTTGLPKGCEHTQRHMLYTGATALGASGEIDADDFVALCYLPVFWIAGEDLGILMPVVSGGTSVLMGRWDAGLALDLIEQERVTMMVGTVENYLELLARDDVADRDLSSLRDPAAVSFVRKLDPEVRRRWREVASSTLREAAYGMTETHTMDATAYGMDAGDRDLHEEPVFCGVPVPGTDIVIRSWDTGDLVPLGQDGEIHVSSPSVMTGYWRNPEASTAQLVDGWLRTGDSGRLDENGCLHFLGRRKELIKVKGMSVFPAEIEMVVARLDGVASCAVVPTPDADRGEVPVAFVTLSPGSTATADDLRAQAAEQLASYKVPRIVLLDAFPMTATGKIRKVELEERASQSTD